MILGLWMLAGCKDNKPTVDTPRPTDPIDCDAGVAYSVSDHRRIPEWDFRCEEVK